MTKAIPLTKGKFTIVDDEDYEKLIVHKWYCSISKDGTPSACRREHGTRKFVYMHRQIVASPDGKIVDHKDGDTLNNTRSNLRVCGKSENNMNKRLLRTNTSGVRGVHWHKRFGKWQARIGLNNKKIHLGYFDNIRDAEDAYQKAEEAFFGEFSYRKSRA